MRKLLLALTLILTTGCSSLQYGDKPVLPEGDKQLARGEYLFENINCKSTTDAYYRTQTQCYIGGVKFEDISKEDKLAFDAYSRHYNRWMQKLCYANAQDKSDTPWSYKGVPVAYDRGSVDKNFVCPNL